MGGRSVHSFALSPRRRADIDSITRLSDSELQELYENVEAVMVPRAERLGR